MALTMFGLRFHPENPQVGDELDGTYLRLPLLVVYLI